MINWTEEIIERLTEHRKDGLSASESCAKLTAEFGIEFTRNMVIAKRYRMGMTSGREEMRHKSRRAALKRHARVREGGDPGFGFNAPKPKSNPKPKKPNTLTATSKLTGLFAPGKDLPKEPMPKEESPADYARLLKLDELEARSCRFPIGDPKLPDFGFCGDTRVQGQPYCQRHCARAFRAPEPRRQAPKFERVPTIADLEKV